jgi:hypothetical protein
MQIYAVSFILYCDSLYMFRAPFGSLLHIVMAKIAMTMCNRLPILDTFQRI